MAGCRWKRAEGTDSVMGARGVRPYHVYDHEGTHLGSFAVWQAAHDWAHLQVALTSLPAPLDVEDRRLGTCRRVWADHCEAHPAETRRDQDSASQPTPSGCDETHVMTRPGQPAGAAPYPAGATEGAPTPPAAATATLHPTDTAADRPASFSPPRPRRPS
jgi:hypothetical protein